MSYWIEIRCSLQKSNECYSSRQINSPMQLSRNSSMAAIINTISTISKEAKSLGWRDSKIGWICPKCH